MQNYDFEHSVFNGSIKPFMKNWQEIELPILGWLFYIDPKFITQC